MARKSAEFIVAEISVVAHTNRKGRDDSAMAAVYKSLSKGSKDAAARDGDAEKPKKRASKTGRDAKLNSKRTP